MLAERVKEWSKNWKQEGKLEGRQEGESEFLLYLLEQRFGQVSETVRERIETADSQTLLFWGKRILTAQTIEEVFAD